MKNIRIITVSGRIGCGATALAEKLSKVLNWRHIEGGEIFWEALKVKLGLEEKDTDKRPDAEDQDFDESLKRILQKSKNIILETKLAGFNAQEIDNVFKIAVVCEDGKGHDQAEVRIDRLMNREKISLKEAKEEVMQREKNDLEKWRRLYANNDQDWVYWDKKYYDLVINTFSSSKEETLKTALDAIGYKK